MKKFVFFALLAACLFSTAASAVQATKIMPGPAPQPASDEECAVMTFEKDTKQAS